MCDLPGNRVDVMTTKMVFKIIAPRNRTGLYFVKPPKYEEKYVEFKTCF